MRQVKTHAEIKILRAVNTGTVEAIRAMWRCLEPGLTDNDVMLILDNVLLSIGFDLFFDIVLFDSNAALRHGGFKTGDKVLTYDTMVLINVGQVRSELNDFVKILTATAHVTWIAPLMFAVASSFVGLRQRYYKALSVS